MNRRSFLHAIGLLPLEVTHTSLAYGPHGRDRAQSDCRTGLVTGFAELDAITGPLQPGELLFIASPPCSGKTTLALTFARHACEQYDRQVVYWGPHTHEDRRLVAACRTLSAVKRGSFRIHCMNDPLDLRGADAAGLLIIDAIPDHPVWIDDWSLNESVDGGREICEKLREMSLRYRCPILVVTELSGLAQRPRHTPPQLVDLGLLREAAQRNGRVVLMHRPSLYDPSSTTLWRRVAVLESPRQCADPSGPRCVTIVHDSESGMFRSVTYEELQNLFEGPDDVPAGNV
jgi:hypothetical protein